MTRLRARLLSLRDLLATAWPIVLIVGAGFVVAWQYVEPAPPRTLTLTTGGEAGAYHAFAQAYARILERHGVEVRLQTSAGAIENVARLRAGAADVGFVQGGVPLPESGDEDLALRSLGSLYYEPVWVFYRGTQPVARLADLAGRRIAVGAEGSGIRGLALTLLEANEIPIDRNLLPLTGLNAAEELQHGRIDAAFVIAAPEAPVVQVLLRSPGVRLLSFAQAEAYVRRFPYLTRVVLPRGAVDLVRDVPARDVHLLAATANLVVSERTHPALIALLLQAAREVHGRSGFFQRAGEFPADRDHTFPLDPDARRYYQSGPPFLQRYLPFWAAVLVDRLIVLLLPLVALLLPLLRIAPAVYSWRIRARIFSCYGELKYLEHELRTRYEPARHADYLARLDRLEEEANSRNVPLAFTDLVYTLREHIHLVRRTLARLPNTERTP